MRKLLFAAAAIAALTVPALAQDAFAGSDVTEPHSGQTAKTWAEIVMRSADVRGIVNKPLIDIVNATGSALENTTCVYGSSSSKITGEGSYWSESAFTIPAWKIETAVNVKKFDNWCESITALTADGDIVTGHLYLSPNPGKPTQDTKNITAAAFLVFPPPAQ